MTMDYFMNKISDILYKFVPADWTVEVDPDFEPDVAIVTIRDGLKRKVRYFSKTKYDHMYFMEDCLTEEIKEMVRSK